MHRLAPILFFLAACATPDAEQPTSSLPDTPAAPDTLIIDAATAYGAMPERPVAPVRVDRACPFECCAYSTWTTTEDVALYAAPDDTTAQPIATLPAGMELNAQTGHVLLTRLGSGVIRDSAQSYVDYETYQTLPDGARVLTLGYVGEGAYRVWHDGRLGETMDVASDYQPFGVVIEEEEQAQWWARVRTPNGRIGWLWMDRAEVDIPYGC